MSWARSIRGLLWQKSRSKFVAHSRRGNPNPPRRQAWLRQARGSARRMSWASVGCKGLRGRPVRAPRAIAARRSRLRCRRLVPRRRGLQRARTRPTQLLLQPCAATGTPARGVAVITVVVAVVVQDPRTRSASMSPSTRPVLVCRSSVSADRSTAAHLLHSLEAVDEIAPEIPPWRRVRDVRGLEHRCNTGRSAVRRLLAALEVPREEADELVDLEGIGPLDNAEERVVEGFAGGKGGGQERCLE